MDWKNFYEKTLKNICEADVNDFETIVEQPRPEFSVDLVHNPNAKPNALFSFKLDNKATEEDYKLFCEYVFTYIGEDVNDYINEDFDPDDESDYD